MAIYILGKINLIKEIPLKAVHIQNDKRFNTSVRGMCI